MDTLNTDVLVEIFKYIDEFTNLLIVSKQFNGIFHANSLIWSHYIENNIEYAKIAEKLIMQDYDKYKTCVGLEIIRDKCLWDDKVKLIDIFYKQNLSVYYYSRKIPDAIGQLINLQTLDLSRIQLIEIPKGLCQLVNLRKLWVLHNVLTKIPKELGQLVNLQILDLRCNQLIDIPKEINGLVKLRQLYLNDNHLVSIPKEIGQLTNLEILGLGNNQLTEIPKELDHLKHIIQI